MIVILFSVFLKILWLSCFIFLLILTWPGVVKGVSILLGCTSRYTTVSVALKQKDKNLCWKINCYLFSFLLGNKIRLYVCNFGTKIHNLVVKSYICIVCKTHLCMVKKKNMFVSCYIAGIIGSVAISFFGGNSFFWGGGGNFFLEL